MAKNHLSKNSAINARLEDALRARIDRIHQIYGTTDSVVLLRLLEAFCDHVEAENAVRFPIVICRVEPLHAVAEPKGKYPSAKS